MLHEIVLYKFTIDIDKLSYIGGTFCSKFVVTHLCDACCLQDLV